MISIVSLIFFISCILAIHTFVYAIYFGSKEEYAGICLILSVTTLILLLIMLASGSNIANTYNEQQGICIPKARETND